MALVLIPPPTVAMVTDLPLGEVVQPKRGPLAHLGRGPLRPFRRDEKNDFANAEGEVLVKACVGQCLGMRASSARTTGELAWDPQRGSKLHLLRHMNNDLVLQELGRLYVVDALKAYEPRVRVTAVKLWRVVLANGSTALFIKLRYDLMATDRTANKVLRKDIQQTVELAA